MDISQMLQLIKEIGPPALGAYGTYKAVKIRKRRNEKRIRESGLLEASGMGLDEVDIGRTLSVIKLSEDPPEHLDIESLRDLPRLRVAARELDGLCRAYSSFLEEHGRYPDSARDNFYMSLGVRIYIDKRYIGQKRFGV